MHRKEWKWKHNNPKPVGHCKSSAKGKVHSNTGIPQETRKSQINILTLHLKQLEREEMENPRVSRRKEILKIRAEINAKETKETIAKINKAKSWFFPPVPFFFLKIALAIRGFFLYFHTNLEIICSQDFFGY